MGVQDGVVRTRNSNYGSWYALLDIIGNVYESAAFCPALSERFTRVNLNQKKSQFANAHRLDSRRRQEFLKK